MSLLENITLQMNLDDKNFEREFKSATRTVNKQMDVLTLGAEAFEAKWEDITSNLRSVKRVASGLAISAAIYGITDAVTSASSAILNFRNNLEASKISMEYFAQESAQAQEYIRELEDFAAYTPFSTESAISMAQYLQAMSVPINASKSVLTVISDTAAATGATEENMQRIVTALGQVLTKGKLAAEEVRQLANANIPIYDILKEQLNLTGQEIKNLGNLNINASKAVVAILDGLKERYEGASEKIANTLGGMTETIKDDALIISESFFHGTLDRLEDKIRGIRDQLDEWRDIALHQGTGGMIEAIIGDIGKTEEERQELEQFIIAAIAGFKNLGATIREFTTKNGNMLKIFAKTAYAGIMGLTIAADYLLRGFNLLQAGGEKLISIIDKLTGLSLELSDVVAGLLIFNTVGKTLMFAGNTAFWAGKQFITLGTTLTSVLPVISSSSAFVKGLTAGLITLGAAAASAYFGLKAIQGATGVTGNSSLVSDEYKRQMEEMDNQLSAWEESLNQDYSSIADSWAAQMSDALDDTEKKAKKTAKKIQKTWLMSFDEVFQIREDPEDPLAGELEKFEDINWADFFTLPEFRFPGDALEDVAAAATGLGTVIEEAQAQVGLLNGMIPALIMVGTGILTNFNNARKFRENNPTPVSDEELSDKELKTKLDEDLAAKDKHDKLLEQLVEKYTAETKVQQEAAAKIGELRDTVRNIEQKYHDADLTYTRNPTLENKAVLDKLDEQLSATKKELQVAQEARVDGNLRTQYVHQMQSLLKKDRQVMHRIFERQALLGDTRTISTASIDNADAMLAANDINKQIAAVEIMLDTLRKNDSDRNRILRQLATSTDDNFAALMKQSTTLQSEILATADILARDLNTLLRTITEHSGMYGGVAGIDMRSLENILTDNFRTIRQRLNVLTKNISVNDIEDVADRVGSISSELASIRKSYDSYVQSMDRYGFQQDWAKDAVEKQLRTLEKFEKPYNKLLEALDNLSLNQEAAAVDPKQFSLAVSKAEEAVRQAAAVAANAQDLVKVHNPMSNEAMSALYNIESLERNLKGIPNRATEQLIDNVYSLAHEAQTLLGDGVLYSTTESKWRDRVGHYVYEISKKINALPDGAETKAASQRLLAITQHALGLKSASAVTNPVPLDVAIAEYADKVISALQNTGNGIYEQIEKQSQMLREGNVLTADQTEQLNKFLRAAEKDKAAVDNLSVYKASYAQEGSTIRALDAISQQFNDLAAASTGAVQELYIKLNNALNNTADAALVRNTVNTLINDFEKQFPNGIGNTRDTLRRLFDDSNLTLTLEMAEAIEQTAQASKPTANKPAQTSKPLLSDVFADTFDEVEAEIDEYFEYLKTKALKPTDFEKLLTVQSELLDILNHNPGYGHSIGNALLDRFNVADLDGNLVPVPDAYVSPMQYATITDDVWNIHSDIEDVLKRHDSVVEKLDKVTKDAIALYKQIKDNGWLYKGTAYDNNDVLNDLKSSRLLLIDKLNLGEENAARTVGELSKSSLEKLKSEYERFVNIPGGFEKRTGTLKAFSQNAKNGINNRFYGLYGPADSGYAISNAASAATAAYRLGAYPGSITEQGTTAQGAIAALLGHSMSDEIADSFESAIQRGIAAGFNIRTRPVLEHAFGNLYTPGTGTDATGTYALSVSGLTEIEDGLYGVIQRIAVSDNSAIKLTKAVRDLQKSAQGTIKANSLAVVPFGTFEKRMRNIAPDIVNKLASGLLAGDNLDGIILSVTNAASQYLKPLVNNVLAFRSKAANLDFKQTEKWAEQSIATQILQKNMLDARYTESMENLVIVPDDELLRFVDALDKNVQLLHDAAEANRIAQQQGLALDMSTTTTRGVAADASMRYADIEGALKNVKSADSIFEALIDAASEADTILTGDIAAVTQQLAQFDAYVRSTTRDALASGNIRQALQALKKADEQIRDKQLQSAQNLFVVTEQFRFNIESDAPAEAFEAAAQTVQELQAVLNDTTPKLLSTYNDYASKMARRIAAETELTNVIRDSRTEFEILISTAQKLEAAFGLDDKEISRRWTALRDTGDTNILNITDPFRYLNLDESVGKMYHELQQQTGLDIRNLFMQAGIDASDSDLARIAASVEAYLKTTDAALTNFISYPPSTIQPPYLGEPTNEEINEYIESIMRASEDASTSISSSAADTIADNIVDAIAKGLDDGAVSEEAPKLIQMLFGDFDDVLDDVVDDAANTVREGAWSRLKKSLSQFLSDAGTDTINAGKRTISGIKQFFDDVVKAAGADLSGVDVNAVVGSLEEYLKEYSPEMQQVIRNSIGNDGAEVIRDFIGSNGGQASIDDITDAIRQLYNSPLADAGGVLDNSRPYYSAFMDPDLINALKASMSDEYAAQFEQFVDAVAKRSFKADYDAMADPFADDSAFAKFMRGEGFDGEGIKATDKEIKKMAQEAFGDNFEAFEKVLKELAPEERFFDFDSFINSQKSGLVRTLTGEGLAGRLFDVTMNPKAAGISGLDLASAVAHTFDTMSRGFDEYLAARAQLSAATGYDVNTLNRQGEYNTSNNLIDWRDAAESGGQYLVTTGALTTALSSALSSILSGTAFGSVGGIPGMVAGAATSAVAAVLTMGGMALTGGFNMSNIASEEWKNMLNDHDWAYNQAKEQGATDEQAREAQLKAERSIYLEHYNNMSSLWSGFDVARIRELAGVKGPGYAGTNKNDSKGDKIATQYAINEILGVLNDGYSIEGDHFKEYKKAYWYDPDKVESQLYTLYTTGGISNIDDYNDSAWYENLLHIGNKGTGLSKLEYDWAERIDELDELTRARLDDHFDLVVKATEYINDRGPTKVKKLLEEHGITAESMTEMIEGVIWLYNTNESLMRSIMNAKGEIIKAGDIPSVDANVLLNSTGIVERLFDGVDLSNISQEHINSLKDATGVYLDLLTDTTYMLSYDIEEVRNKMTGFTVAFPDTITVGADTLKVSEIRSDTEAISILKGMGININADGSVTVATVAKNVNESGHDRQIDYSIADISKYELNQLANAGINLRSTGDDEIGIRLAETSLQNAIKGLTYNLNGIDLTSVSTAAIEALKASGINLAQNQETGAVSATITDAGYISGSRDIATLLSSIDPSILERLNTNLTDALKGIDAINTFGARHGESRMGAAAGIEVDTGFLTGEYSTALEQAFKDAGITLQAALDEAGNEHVYAAINNVGESWHKAITQWKTSEITPELRAFLDELGAEVYTSGQYTMVSTESILEQIGKTNNKYLTSILFDNAEMWEQFPEDTKAALIAAGLATEDGFIKLTGEALSGWTSFKDGNSFGIKMAYNAMSEDIKKMFTDTQGTTVQSWDTLTNVQKYWLGQLGITSSKEYAKGADELLDVATNKLGLIKNGSMLKWSELSTDQKNALKQLGIDTEKQYNANSTALAGLIVSKMGLIKDGNFTAWEDLSNTQLEQLSALGINTKTQYEANTALLREASNTGFTLIKDDTVLGWDQLSDTTRTKLAAHGIATEEQYKAFLKEMDVETGTGLSQVDATTRGKLEELGTTTGDGWGTIKQITDDNLSETEKLALGYMKFEDLPDTIKQALMEGYGDNAWQALHDSWWAINTDAERGEERFGRAVEGMVSRVAQAKQAAQELRAALDSSETQAAMHNAQMLDLRSTALTAANSLGSSKYSDSGKKYVKNAQTGVWEQKLWSDMGSAMTNKALSIGAMNVAINSDKLTEDGSPRVYYIYDTNLSGGKQGQMIYRVDTGKWQRYEGGRPFNTTSNLPAFKMGGMVTGDGYFRAGEFGLNEAIVPLEQPQAMRAVGTALAAAIPTWELVAPLAGMLGVRDGGVAPTRSFHSEKAESSVEDIVSRIMDAQAHRAPQPSYNGGNSDDRRPLYVGTLIADKAGLRELDRQMKRVARQDGGM